MQTKDFNSLLAKSIKDGIAKSQSAITKNNAKEQSGLKKLQKNLTDQPGTGTDLSSGSGTTGISMNLAEVKPEETAKKTYLPNGKETAPSLDKYPTRAKRVSAKKNNQRAEFEASKVEKGELGMGKTNVAKCGCGWMATVLGKVGDTTHFLCSKCGNHSTSKGNSSQFNSKVAKSETSGNKNKSSVVKLPDGSGFSTATIGKSELNPNTKKAPMIGTVEAKNVEGAKDGSEPIPEAKKTDNSGDITKGKIEKGAMVDHIKEASKKAGVNVKDVLGYKPPKTSQAVSPTPTPNFNKAYLPPDSKPRIPYPTRTVPSVAAVMTSASKPVIPGRGVANTVSSNLNPNTVKIFGTGHKVFSSLVSPEPKPPLSTQVTKAEPTMAKPVTKSPSSGPANTSTPKAASPIILKTPKL
jgi:hypothetical protein